MDKEKQKTDMLLNVRNYFLRFGGVGRNEKKIISAISQIDRKFFVPKNLQGNAYADEALAIEKGQTISQPSTVARMLSILKLKKGNRVLEIGAGSGWNACLIAKIVNPGRVLSLDLHEELVNTAKPRVSKFKLKNLSLKCGDFRKLKEKFDRVIFTAGLASQKDRSIVEKFAASHLNAGGILICPRQLGPLAIISKDKIGKISKTQTKEEYVFVPLVLD